ncbi:hypothetical protein Mgra_00004149 [Meloidogyne graminicola]|uniref:Uncharacterized protein n=1 Tax=Meloidogyne graminicola TaxID=189291 RepID=A0A8S9ZT52_9BILA|nr:hypothetical protein Mgra_00004149 [Meloidogyne graminicola]
MKLFSIIFLIAIVFYFVNNIKGELCCNKDNICKECELNEVCKDFGEVEGKKCIKNGGRIAREERPPIWGDRM